MTPNELLLAAGDGDQHAFARFYDQMIKPTRVIVEGFVDEPSQVDALTTAIMLEAWRTASTFDPTQTSASQWLLTMARTRAAAHVRRSRGRAADLPTRGGRRERRVGQDAPVPDAIETEQLVHALASLPAGEKQALQLAVRTRTASEDVETAIGERKRAATIASGLRRLRTLMTRLVA